MSAAEVVDNASESQENVRKSQAPPKPESDRTARLERSSVGRWTLLKPLARGGMGEVYLGTAGGIEGAERPCVVKIIRREHHEDPSFLARFFDEARIQAQLQHPGVAQVLEASTDQSGKPYVVLEYIEGRNLSEVRQRAAQLKLPLSWADAVAVAVSLAEALVHVHERTDAAGRALDIVHRDMSPQNVMVGYAGDVKLIDFGTARGENRRCQTVSGVVFAKPGYVAPEVANQNQPGPQADLYALGIIAWELLVGRRFLTGDPSEHLAKVASGEYMPAPVSSSQNVPLELDTIVARLTAPDLHDRYQTAREALTDLARVLSRAPSLADGERSVRGRIAHLMSRLYPSEPMRSRSEFVRLLHERRQTERRTSDEQPQPLLLESPQPSAASEVLPGTRYQLVRELSKSSMSVVYEAVHVDLERKVALKILPKERCEDPRFEARFRKEARSIAQLRDDSVVTLHDFGVSQDGRPYCAMELLEGQTLAERSLAQPLSTAEALQVGIGVCRGLEAAHARGIIHRDIKPSNVFLTHDGKIKLLDFGVAQAGAEERDDENSNALHVNGTPEYMAPEQIGRGDVTERADIYALGTLLYELVTGELPFRAESTVQLLDDKRRHAPVPPRQLRPNAGLPSRLDTVLLRALDPDPARRFATAIHFRDALVQLRDHSKKTSRPALATLAAAAGLLAAGAGALNWKATGHALPLEPWRWERPELVVFASSPASSPTTNEVRPRAEPTNVPAAAVEAPRAKLSPPPVSPDELEAEPTLDDEDPSADGALAADRPEATPPTDPAPQLAAEPSTARGTDAPLDPVWTPEDTERAKLAKRLLSGGRADHLRALDLFRVLGRSYPEDPAVLEGWSRAAAKGKWWGESLQVAIRWASTDPSPQAQLHLARTQRQVGQRYGAIQTLERLLSKEPRHAEAAVMLERYRTR